jgi:hypothetical protein
MGSGFLERACLQFGNIRQTSIVRRSNSHDTSAPSDSSFILHPSSLIFSFPILFGDTVEQTTPTVPNKEKGGKEFSDSFFILHPSSFSSTPSLMRNRFIVPLLLLLLLCGSAHAQSNFSFRIGATAIEDPDGTLNYGPNVGFGGKFNIMDLIRVRGQFDVDRVLLTDIRLPDFEGEETHTYICLGAGLEFVAGSSDLHFILNVVPHGAIRTNVRTIPNYDGSLRVTTLTRFSIGTVIGAGGEFYLTNNIGFEALAQYVIFNFDQTELEPMNTGFRATLGMQFYLGLNYVRPDAAP